MESLKHENIIKFYKVLYIKDMISTLNKEICKCWLWNMQEVGLYANI